MIPWLLDHPAQGDVQEGLLSGLSHPKLARALTCEHERPGEAGSLDAMAREAGMSRSAFAAEVEAVLGATLGDDLLRWRVSISQTTPRGGAPVKLISDDLGYARPAAFFRGFAQVPEASPRAWMKDI